MNAISRRVWVVGLALLAAARADAALLTGELFAQPAITVNLTAEGTTDWIHWGRAATSEANRKVEGGSRISNFALIKAGTNIARLTTSPSKYTWNDGSPVASANSQGGVYTTNYDGPGRGFQFTVAADDVGRMLKVYVGTFNASGTLQAVLSGSSQPAYSETLVGSADQTVQGVYVIQFAAASPGQTLTVKWTETADLGAADNITMQAAILCSPPLVPEPASLLIIGGAVMMLARRRGANQR